MQVTSILRAGFAGVALLALSSCDETAVSGGSFKAKYAVARDALENGQYDRAKRQYLALIKEAGPLASRLQLEYAHAELRSGNYAQAASIASNLAASQSGKARASSLSVQGTAQHELALELLAEGQKSGAKEQLKGAEKALATVIKDHPDLDPIGSLAGRLGQIRKTLKTL
ncbi:hypothetical protein [Pacificoceanicola onchidii]|uniref:hypothetical protein n=1 Tax=Pacificoceanicola onchidii TaxID=2562685 RepID=UPI0010A35BE4|nr:hypothetical protein [Pacificoceanicola onchidii]